MKTVENRENPYFDLWTEFKSGKISLDEMSMAMYSRIIQNRELSGFKYKYPPEKPIEYRMREQKFLKSIKTIDDELERRKSVGKFYADLKERYKAHEIELSKVRTDNLSNLLFLNGMHEFLKEKAPNLAVQVLGAIETHKIEVVAI